MDNIVDVNTAADIWERGNNLHIFRGRSTSKEDLEKEWLDFEANMTIDQQMKADDESIRLFGKTNLERFKELHKKFFETDSISESVHFQEDEVEDAIQFPLTDEIKDKVNQAKQYMHDMNTIIMYPTETLDELEDLYQKMHENIPIPDILNNDNKTIELFGYTNEELYKRRKAQFLKFDYDHEMKLDDINISNTAAKLDEATDIISIIGEYTNLCNMNSQSNDTIYEANESISRAEDRLINLLEYTPMASLNPMIGMGPMPMYLPNEFEIKSELPNPNIDLVSRYNKFFDGLYQGMSADEDIVDVQYKWYNTVQKLQSEYIISTSNPNDKMISDQLRETIFALGWHPDYDISKIENWEKVNKNILQRIKEQYYGNNKIIDLHEGIELADLKDTDNEKEPERIRKRRNLNPVYIVLTAGIHIDSALIKMWTRGPFSHSAIGFDHTLRKIYSYNDTGENTEHRGLSVEGIDFYDPKQRVLVYCIFINNEDLKILKTYLNYFINNKERTHYSRLNILSFVFKKPINFEYDMVCSQFVDRLLKFINIDLTGNDSSLVSPNDIFRAGTSNNRIYKIYDGKIRDYNADKIKVAVSRLLRDDNTVYFKEFANLLLEAGAKILKHRKTSTTHEVPSQIYRNNSLTNNVGLGSDDYHKVLQQHSIEFTEKDIEEFERLLTIDINKDPQKLVDEFNKWIDGEFDKVEGIINVKNTEELEKLRKATERDKRLNDESGMSYLLGMQTDMLALKQAGYDDKAIRRILKKDYFLAETDPIKLHKELQFRVNYNKKIIRDFKSLIKKNYELLEATELEVIHINNLFNSNNPSDQFEAIKMIKDILDRNSNKFQVNPNVYDLRGIDLGRNHHAGVVCISKEGVNKKLEILSRVIQKALEWDVVIYAHGNTHPIIKGIESYRTELNNILDRHWKDSGFDSYVNYVTKYMNDPYQHRKYAEDIYNAIDTLFNIDYDNNKIIDKSETTKIFLQDLIHDEPKTVDGIEATLEKSVEKALNILVRDVNLMVLGSTIIPDEDYDIAIQQAINDFLIPVASYYCRISALDEYLKNHTDWMWTVQPTYSAKAGPFTSMNELLRQLVFKEGFKKILILSCNPGGHDIPDDIKNKANILIKYGDVMNLVEGDEMAKTFDDCLNTIENAEYDLVQECNKYGIDYDNDEYLLECYNELDQNLEILKEKQDDKSTDWKSLSGLIKNIIGGLTWAFKQALNFFKFIFGKMKRFFYNIINHGKFDKPVKATFIHIDKKNKAKLKTTTVSSYDELEKATTAACSSITDAVTNYQKDNLKVYDRFDKYANKMASKQIHEGFIIESDNELSITTVGDRCDELWDLINNLNKKDKEYLALNYLRKQKEIHDSLTKSNKHVFILCDNEGNILGYFRESKDNDYHVLEDLVVFPKYRGNKYGDILLKYFCNTFNKSYTKCKPDNKVMQNLLIKHGFKCQYYKYDKTESVELDRPDVWIRTNNISNQDIIDDIFDYVSKSIVNEAKEFPVQFDNDGNLLIKNYKKMDYNKEYQHSHELLKTYHKSEAYEGIKYELARLWFVNTVITAQIYENKNISDEDKKEFMKIRAWIMNDFTKYNKIYSTKYKEFNFSEYYNTTPFSDVYIKINSSTIKFLGNLLSLIIKRK